MMLNIFIHSVMERLGVLFVFLAILLLAGIFGVYVYVFALQGGDIYSVIPENGSGVLGINVATNNYNFEIPEDISRELEPLLSEKVIKKVEDTAMVSNTTYALVVPKINLVTDIVRSNDITTLEEQGWILLPWSYEYTTGFFRFPPWKDRGNRNEAIIVSYRKFYGRTHERASWNLNELQSGDELAFDSRIFRVESVILRQKAQETIFEPENTGEYLKIITNSDETGKPGISDYYLVLIAKVKE